MIRKALLTISFVVGAVFASSYCSGWSDGYVEGYCYSYSIGCISPIVPICPIPYLGQDEYSDGYNRGFLAGLNAGRRN